MSHDDDVHELGIVHILEIDKPRVFPLFFTRSEVCFLRNVLKRIKNIGIDTVTIL